MDLRWRKLEKLIMAYDEYIALLGESELRLLGFVHVHGGGVPPDLVERGRVLREKIEQLKTDLYLQSE